MKTSHTPGKWQYNDNNEIFTFLEESKITFAKIDFSHIRFAFNARPNTKEQKHLEEQGYKFDFAAEQANAKLIVVAPEMLEYLQALMYRYKQEGIDQLSNRYIALRNLIAKATE